MAEQIAPPKAKSTGRSGSFQYAAHSRTTTVVTLKSPEVDEQQEVRAGLRTFMQNLADQNSEPWEQEEGLENFRNWLLGLPAQNFQEVVRGELIESNLFIQGQPTISYESNDGTWQAVHRPTGLRGSGKNKNDARRGLEDEILGHLEPWKKLPDLLEIVDQIKQEIVKKAYTAYS